MGFIKVLIGVCALVVGVVGLFKPLPNFKIKNRTVAIYVVILSFLFIMLGTTWPASQDTNIGSLSISDFLVAEIQFYLMYLLIITLFATVAALIKPSLFKFVFKDKTSRKVAGGSFFALFVIIAIISGAMPTSVTEVTNDFTAMQFESPQDIIIFAEDNKIEFAKIKNKWIASTEKYQPLVDLMHNEYQKQLKLYEERNIAKATKLIAAPITEGVSSRIETLSELADEIKNEEVIDKIRKEIKRLEPIEAKEKARILEEKKRAERIQNEVGDRPENSAWDGSVLPVKEFMGQVLKDPDSVKYHNWGEVTLVQRNGRYYWQCWVDYSARNSFGGMNRNTLYAFIQHGVVVDYVNR